jgi:hypothetical protein
MGIWNALILYIADIREIRKAFEIILAVLTYACSTA